jgi:hypothetical protein
MQNVPEWAEELTIEVCREYKRSLPDVVQWYSGSSKWTSGHWTYYTSGSIRACRLHFKIHITAGTDPTDARYALLHELAHHIVGKTKAGRKEHHSMRFWLLTWELCDKYGITIDEVLLKRAEQYRGKSRDAHIKHMAKRLED